MTECTKGTKCYCKIANFASNLIIRPMYKRLLRYRKPPAEAQKMLKEHKRKTASS